MSSSIPYPPVPPERGMNFTKVIHHDTYAPISTPTTALAGRRVLITGASKGIGRSTALAYARAGASYIALGARSSLTSVETEVLAAAKEAGHEAPRILLLSLDITSRSSINDAAESVSKEFGKLDILINNAAVLEKWATILESDEDKYWNTWETNYRGIYWMTKSFLPLLLDETDGEGMKTIVNVTSGGALNLTSGASAYQTTKFALLKFTEFIMIEYGPKGVLSFAVHPGGVPTEMGLKMPEHMHSLLQDTPEMGADTICYLTQEKRPWLAGRYISCSWDMPELLSREKEIVEGDKLKMKLVF